MLQVSYNAPPRDAAVYAEAIKDFMIKTGRYFKGGGPKTTKSCNCEQHMPDSMG